MTATGREIGTLIVVILKAKNLPNKRHIGKQDPYCSVTLNGENRKTKAIKRGGQHPEWDEEIRFTLFEEIDDALTRPVDDAGTPPPLPPKSNKGPPSIQGGKFMKLACYADDMREPSLIGETNVDLTEVLTKGETDEWFALSAKDKYAGEVYLELTFWSNEPAPKKKSKSQHNPNNSQYGGAGSFVPFSESSVSLDGSHSFSRAPSISSLHDHGSLHDRDPSSLTSSLRSYNSSAQLDLYTAPYERNSAYHMAAVDSVTNDFSELGFSESRQRRETFPPLHHPARPPSAQPIHSQTFSGYSQSAYLDSGLPNPYDRPPTSNDYQPQSSFLPSHNYQVSQHTGSSDSYHPPPRGPRYSLPNNPNHPSGFVPISTPAPSGFMPLRQQPESVGFAFPVNSTPGPMNYGLPPSNSHPSSFLSHPPAPSGFMPTSSSLSFHPSYQYPSYRLSSATPVPYVQPPPSAPPLQYAPPLPPSSVPPHSHSAPPPRIVGHSSATPSPPRGQFPTLQPNQGGTPPSAHSSRPLPQPQISSSGQVRRKSTLPIPPGGGFSPSNSPSRGDNPYQIGSYPYNSIPPPPPLPSQNHTWIANDPQANQPPPPPPLPPQSRSNSPPRRFNLPQPPVMLSHQQQQSIMYQQIPPPPTNIPSHSYISQQEPPSHYPQNTHAPDGGYYPAE